MASFPHSMSLYIFKKQRQEENKLKENDVVLLGEN